MSDKRLITENDSDEVDPAIVDKPAPEAKVRLLEAAEDHFGDHGFAGASLRTICQAAGVNLASVKYYFGDKEGLYIATVAHAHQCNAAVEMETDFPHDAPPHEQLQAFIDIVAHRMCAPARPSAMKLMMREMADPGKAAHVVVQQFIQPMAFMLRGILRRLLPGTPEPKLLMTGFSVIGQILYYRQNRPISELIFGKPAVEALTADMVAEHVMRFTFAALGLGEPGDARKRSSPSPLEGEGGSHSEPGEGLLSHRSQSHPSPRPEAGRPSPSRGEGAEGATP